MPRAIQVRVGAYTVWSDELGFEWVDIFKLGGPWELFTIVAFYRYGVPAMIVERGTLGDEPFPAMYFASAMTPSLDYPTKPFISMHKLLKEQWGTGEASRDIHAFIEDVAGLLVFALARRGVEVDIYDVWTAKPSEIREWVEEAGKPAPGLGNGWYAAIAAELAELFIKAMRLENLEYELSLRL